MITHLKLTNLTPNLKHLTLKLTNLTRIYALFALKLTHFAYPAYSEPYPPYSLCLPSLLRTLPTLPRRLRNLPRYMPSLLWSLSLLRTPYFNIPWCLPIFHAYQPQTWYNSLSHAHGSIYYLADGFQKITSVWKEACIQHTEQLQINH